MPRQKSEALTESVSDEALVYLASDGQVHNLNPLLAKVWAHCDGITPRALVQERLGMNEETLEDCLQLLSQSSLLQEALPRRQLLRRASQAAAAVILTLGVPRPAAAASCGGNGAPCAPAGAKSSCCVGFFCSNQLGGPQCQPS